MCSQPVRCPAGACRVIFFVRKARGVEAELRRLFIITLIGLAVVASGGLGAVAGTAGQNKAIEFAQTSTTTNCMMACNSQAASCQTTCVVPGTAPTSAATSTSNATAGQSCLSNCSSQELACQTDCARTSPSQ